MDNWFNEILNLLKKKAEIHKVSAVELDNLINVLRRVCDIIENNSLSAPKPAIDYDLECGLEIAWLYSKQKKSLSFSYFDDSIFMLYNIEPLMYQSINDPTDEELLNCMKLIFN